MNNKRIDSVVREYAQKIEEETSGYWRFFYRDLLMLCITDETHNRMRIISPAAMSEEVNDQMLLMCMEANFDRALDVRYAISGEYLWSVFIHPLEELGDKQFVDAMNQVATLAENYGTTFMSNDLLFGAE